MVIIARPLLDNGRPRVRIRAGSTSHFQKTYIYSNAFGNFHIVHVYIMLCCRAVMSVEWVVIEMSFSCPQFDSGKGYPARFLLPVQLLSLT